MSGTLRRHHSTSSLASSFSGSTATDPGDYTFGFSISGVGLRQQSRTRPSYRPETSLPFNKNEPYDPQNMISEVKHKFVEIPSDYFQPRYDKMIRRSHLTLEGDRHMRTTTKSDFGRWQTVSRETLGKRSQKSFAQLELDQYDQNEADFDSIDDDPLLFPNKNVGVQVALVPDRVVGRRFVSNISLGDPCIARQSIARSNRSFK